MNHSKKFFICFYLKSIRPYIKRKYHVDLLNGKEELVSLSVNQKFLDWIRKYPSFSDTTGVWKNILDSIITKNPYMLMSHRFQNNDLSISGDGGKKIVPDHFSDQIQLLNSYEDVVSLGGAMFVEKWTENFKMFSETTLVF